MQRANILARVAKNAVKYTTTQIQSSASA